MRSHSAVGMLGGLAIGATLGIAGHVLLGGESPALDVAVRIAEPIGAIFLRLLFMLVVPLIVSALALGVAGLGDVRELGRIGVRTLLYTIGVSTCSVLI